METKEFNQKVLKCSISTALMPKEGSEKSKLLISIVIPILTLVIGATFGYYIGIKVSENVGVKQISDNISISELEERVLNFVNSKLVKPGVKAELDRSYKKGEFYAFNLTLFSNGVTVAHTTIYTTKDGKYLILNLIELPEKIETKINESVGSIDIKDEPFKGNESAKILIVEFSGYDCPFCAKFARETLPKILKNFSVKFVIKDFPIHGEAGIKAHEAANCALEQGKYWEYHDILFERQNEWMNNQSKLYDYAKLLNLNLEEFKACLDSDKYREEILKDREEGLRLGVRGTPTFFINGKKVTGALPYEEFEKILKQIN